MNTIAEYGASFENADNHVESYNIDGEALSFVQDNRGKLARGVRGSGLHPLRNEAARRLANIPHVRGDRKTLTPVFLGSVNGNYNDLSFQPMNSKQVRSHTARLHGIQSVITSNLHAFDVKYPKVF